MTNHTLTFDDDEGASCPSARSVFQVRCKCFSYFFWIIHCIIMKLRTDRSRLLCSFTNHTILLSASIICFTISPLRSCVGEAASETKGRLLPQCTTNAMFSRALALSLVLSLNITQGKNTIFVEHWNNGLISAGADQKVHFFDSLTRFFSQVIILDKNVLVVNTFAFAYPIIDVQVEWALRIHLLIVPHLSICTFVLSWQ